MRLKPGTETEYASYVEMNSRDGYSHAVVTYTERWAALMETALDDGAKLEDIARSTSNAADQEGISGFMYGCAVSALAHFWEFGEPLRLWHNLKTQIHDEGERANKSGATLNPAILVLGEE